MSAQDVISWVRPRLEAGHPDDALHYLRAVGRAVPPVHGEGGTLWPFDIGSQRVVLANVGGAYTIELAEGL